METEMAKLDVNAVRFAAIENDYGPMGCMLSHIAVLKEARDKGLKRVLIFEDDFQSLVSREEFHGTLAATPPCDVLMLSYNLIKSEPLNDVVCRVLEAQTASGYIVYESMYDRLIACYEYHAPLLDSTREHWIHVNDQCWKPLQLNSLWLATNVRLGKQRAGFSDNAGCVVDYGC